MSSSSGSGRFLIFFFASFFVLFRFAASESEPDLLLLRERDAERDLMQEKEALNG